MKRIYACLFVLVLLSSSCQSIQNWLFDASDYHLFKQKYEDEILDEENIYWDDFDFDIWFEENEYD